MNQRVEMRLKEIGVDSLAEQCRTLKKENEDVDCSDWNDLISVLGEVFNEERVPFIFVIDEWDALFREHKNQLNLQEEYINFLQKEE